MPAQRLTMRHVRELLRLHYGTGASARAIARELAVSRSTVKDYLTQATAAGVTWPLADELADGVARGAAVRCERLQAGTRRRGVEGEALPASAAPADRGDRGPRNRRGIRDLRMPLRGGRSLVIGHLALR